MSGSTIKPVPGAGSSDAFRRDPFYVDLYERFTTLPAEKKSIILKKVKDTRTLGTKERRAALNLILEEIRILQESQGTKEDQSHTSSSAEPDRKSLSDKQSTLSQPDIGMSSLPPKTTIDDNEAISSCSCVVCGKIQVQDVEGHWVFISPADAKAAINKDE